MKPVILVVDDEEINVNYVANILKDKYDIRVAYNGKMALSILNKIEIDLILLDIKMPNIDGYEVAKEIVNSDRLKSIPFIFLTSKSDEESIIRGFEMGAKDYISKPFNSKELKVRVANHIETHLLQRDLQNLVQEQTKEIIKQKEEIYKQLKKSAMGDLISIIAHQLKQPLSGINISVDMIAEMYYERELTEEYLEKQQDLVHTQVKFMSDSIDDLRNFFRSDRVAKEYNIKHSVDKVLSIIGTDIMCKRIEIETNVDETLSLVGNENELQQVIINLLTNSKDALLDKDIENKYIKIDVFKCEDNICIEVSDNGGGVPEEIIDNIFDSYFTTKGEKGTGIGLNLAKMIVEDSMNGKISVKNSEVGANFSIVFKV
jgi:signal transduction histidine kinase